MSSKRDRNIILFIDELHTLIGAGAAEGAIDAANILKPALARGEIQCIGATTIDEYRKHIEKDAALERRFQPVQVGEPSKEEAVAILKGLRDRYEAHHKVRITDEAIEAAVQLSDRYITDRYLPDKAIDLIDEAASRVRIRSYTTPPDMKELEAEDSAAQQGKGRGHQRIRTLSAQHRLRDEERAIQCRHGGPAQSLGGPPLHGAAPGRCRRGRADRGFVDAYPRHAADRRTNPIVCCTWKRRCISGSSGRTRRLAPSPAPIRRGESRAQGPCIAPSARSCSSAPRA